MGSSPLVWPGAPTWADVQGEVLHKVGHGGEVCRIGEVLLHWLGGDRSQLFFHSFSNTHGKHDNPCVARTDPEHCPGHPAASPEGTKARRQDFLWAPQIHSRNLGRTGRSVAALWWWRMLHEGCCSEHPVATTEHICHGMQLPKAGCCSFSQRQPHQETIQECPKH